MEIYILFDEEMGECQAFLTLEDAMGYFLDEDTGGWKMADGDDTMWLSLSSYFYIFKREIIG